MEIKDTRVFRNGVRVDQDPKPFKCWVKPNWIIQGETPEEVRQTAANVGIKID